MLEGLKLFGLWLFLAATVMSDNVILASALVPPNNNHNNKWLVVDFDGTCTRKDTTPLLPRLACLVHSYQQWEQQQQEKSLQEIAASDLPYRISRFGELESEYFKRYASIQKSLNDQSLEEHLDRLDAVSTEITELVNESGVLKGLGSVSPLELVKIMEKHMKEFQTDRGCFVFEEGLKESLSLHPGCHSVLQKYYDRMASHKHYRMGVLSINWFPALIEASLLHPLQRKEESGVSIPIWSNFVDSHGIVSLPIPGALSKRERIQNLQTESEVVYVGDSSTDLLALLQADVGILFGNSQSTMGLASKFGVVLRSLSDFDGKDTQTVLWTTCDWNEIGSFLEKHILMVE